jgi:ATP-dependent helicase/DNAse subunit B
MLAALARGFDTAWLAEYSTIIVDGLHDATGLEARVLGKIAASGNCTFLVDAPSAGHIRAAGERHPLRLTRDFLERVGITAGEALSPAGADDLFLADALFSERSFAEAAQRAPASFSRKIRLMSAVNTREEVSFIAGEVKQSLRNGTAPDSILVAFPSLDEYGPLVEELFIDFGIPYNRALGRQLGTSPVTTAVVSLLTACQEDCSGPALLRVVSSPFLKFAGDRRVAPALDRFLRERRIIGGRQKLLTTLRRHAAGEEGGDVLSGPLNDLFAALEPFSRRDPAPLLAWMERLGALLAWSGISARVTAVTGLFNINLQAYRKLEETLASLRQAGRLFPEYRYTFSEWLFLLKKTFMRTRFQVPPDDEGGVQVLGLEESMGRPWEEIYLGGLIDGKFPQRLPQNIFLPESFLEPLGVRTLETARQNAAYHFYRLLLSAPRVTLTCPAVVGDKPVVPSPFLAELAPLRLAKLLEEDKDIQFNLQVKDSRSMPELAKSISLMRDPAVLNMVLNADQEGMAAVRAALDRPPAAGPGAIAPQERTEFSVTELDDYLACPYDYYVKHRLNIAPLEEVSEDISALDRGSKVHSILRRFYEEWKGPVTAADRERGRELLASIAEGEFGREADTFRNRREKELFVAVMAERFLNAEEAFWKQGFRPMYLEQKIESFTLTLSDGTVVELHGKIDRIDVDENGYFIVVDYKTGNYPVPVKGMEQKIFQLPVYAVMARQAIAGAGPALKVPIGLAYYGLKGGTGAGARDVVLYNRDVRNDHPAAKPQTSPKSTEEFEAILAHSMDKARQAIEGIRAGLFPNLPLNTDRCRYCPNDMLCDTKDQDED